jgi:hypothetical protein
MVLGFTCGLARQRGAKAPILNSPESSVPRTQIPVPTPSLTSLDVQSSRKGKQPENTLEPNNYAQVESALIQKTAEFDLLKGCWNKALVYIRDYQEIRYREIDLKNKEASAQRKSKS